MLCIYIEYYVAIYLCVSMDRSIDLYAYKSMYVSICTFTCNICVYIDYIHVYVCMYVYTYINIHVHCLYMCIYKYMLCMYMQSGSMAIQTYIMIPKLVQLIVCIFSLAPCSEQFSDDLASSCGLCNRVMQHRNPQGSKPFNTEYTFRMPFL